MQLNGIREEDIVRCDVRGVKFYAFVEKRERGELWVKPMSPGITYRRVKARQVIEHYRKARRRNAAN